jgi:lipopolysaccharide/colanic/teichoic acid biosynthesis glycosyltransferase
MSLSAFPTPSESLLADVTILPRVRRMHERILKRVIDLTGSFSLLCILSPLLLVVMLLISLSDGFPIIYFRRVVGLNGEFDAYKFRTMCRDADAVLETNAELREAFKRNFKLQRDPRVTRLGEWLRRYSLDELPQLVNVLKGQMSLVGPRMITAQELSRYGKYQDLLLAVKPGLTGYWQTRGRQDVSYEERVRMDVYYVTRWSLGLDLRILFETPWKVIRGKGAY